MKVTLDQTGLLKQIDELNDLARNLPQARQRAISTLARRLPPEAKRQILQLYNINSSIISSGLSARVTDTAVELRGSGKGVDLIKFQGRYGGPQTDGSTVQVLKTSGIKTVARSFIPKFRKINQIFTRKKLGSGNLVGRLPIIKLWGPSVGQMLKNAAIPEVLTELGVDVLTSEMARLIKSNG